MFPPTRHTQVKKNLELVVEKGGTPYVPFKENTTDGRRGRISPVGKVVARVPVSS